MKVRIAIEDDAMQLLNLLVNLDKQTKYMLFEDNERKSTQDQIKNFINQQLNQLSTIFVVEDSDRLVGFLLAERGHVNKKRHCVYIVIGITIDYCNQGLGTKLFENLNEWAIKSKVTRLELTVMADNNVAINLYKKMGFKIEGIKVNSIYINNMYVNEYYMAKLLI
jgi:RimJ/RimL family protein N-acetyltransferase